MTVVSEAAVLVNRHSVYRCQCQKSNIFLYMIGKYCDILSPFHFEMLARVAKINPVIVFKSFHVIIFRKAAFAQENICSFYVSADNESK